MQHKIITGNDAMLAVQNLLEEEKDRSAKIAMLNMEEVNLYLDTLRIMQADLERTINTGCGLMSSRIIQNIKSIWGVKYNGYRFDCGTNFYPEPDADFRWLNLDIKPNPPFLNYEKLFIELQQRKRYLENLERIEEKLIQKGSVARFNKIMHRAEHNEKKGDITEIEFIEESIKDAQDQVALQALQSYHDLLNQQRELAKEFEAFKLQEAHKASVLEDTLSQNEKLQQDMKALQSELQNASRENKRIMEEKEQVTDAVNKAQSRIAEQNSELFRLKQSTSSPSIKGADLVNLLNQFNYKSNFFSKEHSDLNSLYKISEAKDESVSSQQIRNCIKDQNLIKIFDAPYRFNHSAALTRPELFVRELGFSMRTQNLTMGLNR